MVRRIGEGREDRIEKTSRKKKMAKVTRRGLVRRYLRRKEREISTILLWLAELRGWCYGFRGKAEEPGRPSQITARLRWWIRLLMC